MVEVCLGTDLRLRLPLTEAFREADLDAEGLQDEVRRAEHHEVGPPQPAPAALSTLASTLGIPGTCCVFGPRRRWEVWMPGSTARRLVRPAVDQPSPRVADHMSDSATALQRYDL